MKLGRGNGETGRKLSNEVGVDLKDDWEERM